MPNFMNTKYIITVICLLALVVAGCEDAFKTVIEIDNADFPPKLAVTATLDTDSGRFNISIVEGRSLQDYKDYRQVDQTIIKDGFVRLFEDDREIFSIPGPFDISASGNSGNQGYRAKFTGIPVKEGCTYRLEVELDGYAGVSSTAVMPAIPVVTDVMLDTSRVVTKNKVMWINSLSEAYSGRSYGSYFPLAMTLADDSSKPDYYSLQLITYQHLTYDGITNTSSSNSEYIGTDNLTMVQDNPDVESKNLMMDSEGYDMYTFDLMMLTDVTFGASDKLSLYASTNIRTSSPEYYYPGNTVYNQPRPYDPDKEIEIREANQTDLIVTHLTTETFKHYRSLAFQLMGLGFFSEPVFINSNMKNGYGCFSVQNSARVNLLEREKYYYLPRNPQY